LTAEGATTSGGHAIDSGQCWLERSLYDAPLPLVANNRPALDDPRRPLNVADWSP
jgi:hypothetical protein